MSSGNALDATPQLPTSENPNNDDLNQGPPPPPPPTTGPGALASGNTDAATLPADPNTASLTTSASQPEPEDKTPVEAVSSSVTNGEAHPSTNESKEIPVVEDKSTVSAAQPEGTLLQPVKTEDNSPATSAYPSANESKDTPPAEDETVNPLPAGDLAQKTDSETNEARLSANESKDIPSAEHESVNPEHIGIAVQKTDGEKNEPSDDHGIDHPSNATAPVDDAKMLEPVQGTANDQNVDPAEKTDGEFSEHSHSNGTDQPTNVTVDNAKTPDPVHGAVDDQSVDTAHETNGKLSGHSQSNGTDHPTNATVDSAKTLEPMQGTPNDQNVNPAQKTNGELSEHSHGNGTDQPTNVTVDDAKTPEPMQGAVDDQSVDPAQETNGKLSEHSQSNGTDHPTNATVDSAKTLEPMQGTPNDQNFDPAQKTNGELSEDLHSKGTAQPTNVIVDNAKTLDSKQGTDHDQSVDDPSSKPQPADANESPRDDAKAPDSMQGGTNDQSVDPSSKSQPEHTKEPLYAVPSFTNGDANSPTAGAENVPIPVQEALSGDTLSTSHTAGESVNNSEPAPCQEQERKTDTSCGCKCLKTCNCQCACPHPDHCHCQPDCEGRCKDEPKGRNLIISIDGTSNTFGLTNTNVVELHSRIAKFVGSETGGKVQLKCYLSGIGTTLPPSAWLLQHLQIKLENVLDLAVAGRFPKIVQDAYRWLMENYRRGDRIFLFGFSRGAYQVRTLAGMIHRLGILEQGNRTLIPFAYNLYLSKYQELRSHSPEAVDLTRHFKGTFSIDHDVQVHFLGAWDTVSSIGVFREMPLPLAHATDHLCFFRHALALDECRVKFIPEYLDPSEQLMDDHEHRARSPEPGTGSDAPGSQTEKKEPNATDDDKDAEGSSSPQSESVNFKRQHYRRKRVKEVWFAGSHSDIGGGYKQNASLNNSGIPLMWMVNEARAVGLSFKSRSSGIAWNPAELQEPPTSSMTPIWRVIEYLPLAVWRSFDNSAWTESYLFKGIKGVVLSETMSPVFLRPWISRLATLLSAFRLSSSIHLSLLGPPSFLLLFWCGCLSGWLCGLTLLLLFFAYTITLEEGKTIFPHLSRGRMILDGQLIHASVAFKPKDYEPEANFAVPLDWSRIVGKVAVNDGQYDALSWPRDLEPRLEKDLFDESFVQDTLNDFIKETDKFKDILPQLSFMTLVVSGADILAGSELFIDTIINIIQARPREQKTYLNSLDCFCRVAKHTTKPTHLLRAFEPLLQQLKQQHEQAEHTDNMNGLPELRLILNSLLYLLKKVDKTIQNQISESMLTDAADLFSELFSCVYDSRPGKRIKVISDGTKGNMLLFHPPSWLLKYISWSKARSVQTEENHKKSRFMFTSAADTVNLLVECMTAALNNSHIRDKFRAMMVAKITVLNALLLDRETRSRSATALLSIASTGDGPLEIWKAGAIDHLIRLAEVESDDFGSFQAGIRCLIHCLRYFSSTSTSDDSQRSSQARIVRCIIPPLVSIIDNHIDTKIRLHAALFIRQIYGATTSRFHPELKKSTLDLLCNEETFQKLVNVVLDDNEDDGLRVMCSDSLLSIVDNARILITQGELTSGNITNLLNEIFLERIAVLLKAMESFSPPDNRPVDKALERHGVRMDDLVMPSSLAETFDCRMVALSVLWVMTGHDVDLTAIPAKKVSEIAISLLKDGGEVSKKYIFFWVRRLLRQESMQRRLVSKDVSTQQTVSNTDSANSPSNDVAVHGEAGSADNGGEVHNTRRNLLANLICLSNLTFHWVRILLQHGSTTSRSKSTSESTQREALNLQQTSQDTIPANQSPKAEEASLLVGNSEQVDDDTRVDLLSDIMKLLDPKTARTSFWVLQIASLFVPYQESIKQDHVQALLAVMCDDDYPMECRSCASDALTTIMRKESMLACLGVFKNDVIQRLCDLTSRYSSHSEEVTAGRAVNTKTSPTNPVQLVLDPLLTLSRHPPSLIGPWINEAFVDIVCHVIRLVSFKDTTYWVRNKISSIIKNVGAVVASTPLLNKLVGTLEQMDGPKDLLKLLKSRLETVNTKQSTDQAATDSESAPKDEQL